MGFDWPEQVWTSKITYATRLEGCVNIPDHLCGIFYMLIDLIADHHIEARSRKGTGGLVETAGHKIKVFVLFLQALLIAMHATVM